MDLKLGHHARDGFEVIGVQGEIDIYTAPRLRELLIDLVSTGSYQLVVNLDKVGFLDSTGLGVLVQPLVLVIVVASLIGLLVSAKSLQMGEAVPVIAVTSVAANSVTIAAGPIVFGDPLPDDTIGLIARLLAFTLVVGAAALTPAPVRAAGIEEEAAAPELEPEPAPAA